MADEDRAKGDLLFPLTVRAGDSGPALTLHLDGRIEGDVQAFEAALEAFKRGVRMSPWDTANHIACWLLMTELRRRRAEEANAANTGL